MAIRLGLAALLVAALTLCGLAGCSGDDDGGTPPAANRTTDADCADRISDTVFTTLGWTATGEPAEATVRGCHREAEQGYVEVRDRSGDYAKLCRTLDRSGGVGPGVPADWVTGFTACAVEPTGDVGQTRVLVKRNHAVTLVTVAVLTSTPQAQVREAVQQLLG